MVDLRSSPNEIFNYLVTVQCLKPQTDATLIGIDHANYNGMTLDRNNILIFITQMIKANGLEMYYYKNQYSKFLLQFALMLIYNCDTIKRYFIKHFLIY